MREPIIVTLTVASSLPSMPLFIELDDRLWVVGTGLAFVLGGLWMIYRGFRMYRTSTLVRDTAPETIGSIAVGRTEVRGRVVPAEETCPRPFTVGECVFATYHVEQYSSGGRDSSRSWATISKGSRGAPFYVEDDTDRVLVDVEDGPTAEVTEKNTTTVTVSAGEHPPPAIEAFIETLDGTWWGEREGIVGTAMRTVERAFTGFFEALPVETERGPFVVSPNPRRFTESVVPVGEEVYVFGEATVREDTTGEGSERLVMRTDGGTGQFILSDREEFALVSRFRRRGIRWMIGGLAVSALALAIVVHVARL